MNKIYYIFLQKIIILPLIQKELFFCHSLQIQLLVFYCLEKFLKIFQKIDAFGYNTSIEWFTYLSSIQLRKLWINLEDIWNYRAFLDPITKSRIVPPNGIVYGTSVRIVYEMDDKYDIMDLIISETNRFENASNDGD